MDWVCPTCDSNFDSFRAYANHYNLSSDHAGNALADAVSCDRLAELYSDMSENAVSEELGVSRSAVEGALRSCNIERRGQSEAERVKNEKMSEEERKQQTEAARERQYEKYGDGGHIAKWVDENPKEHHKHAQEVCKLGAPAREENGMAGVTGQDHPRWRGGKSIYDAVKKQLPGDSWRQKKVEAKERDDNTCQMCGASECKLDSHHIVPIMAGGTNGFWNLITLCESCHTAVEQHTRDLPGMEPVLAE